MKSIRHIFMHYFLAMMLGGLAFSCAEPETTGPAAGDQETIEYGEEGFLSVVLFADNGRAGGRVAAAPHVSNPINIGLEEEDRVRSVRIILYDAYTGNAKYIRDYNIQGGNPSDWVSGVEPPYYQVTAFKIDKGYYKLAVLVNYDNEWIFYNTERDDDATNIDTRTSAIGHNMTELTTRPLDFSVGAGSSSYPDNKNYKARTFAMQTLTGAYDMKISNMVFDKDSQYDYDFTVWHDNAYFFMSNADGLIDVAPSNLKISPTAAQGSPVDVRVERALAKVVMTVSPDITLPPYFDYGGNPPVERRSTPGAGHDIKGDWIIDAVNMKVYPVRKQAYQAPYGAGSLDMETMSTPRLDRYAEDPNWSVVPGTPQVSNEFFSLPEGLHDRSKINTDPVYYELFGEYMNYFWTSDHMTITPPENIYEDPHLDPELPGYIQYVTENTLAPDAEYRTDVASNVVLALEFSYMFDYKDQGDENWYSQASNTYVFYKDIIYPFIMIEDLLENNPPTYEVRDYITHDPIPMTPWLDEFDDQAKIDALKELITEDNGSGGRRLVAGIYKSAAGNEIKIYTGVNFYRAPIPHFKYVQNPQGDYAYGRHGVVRNNTYVLTLEALRGIGSPIYPKTPPITDPENNQVSVAGYVLPWFVKWDEYWLGGPPKPSPSR